MNKNFTKLTNEISTLIQDYSISRKNAPISKTAYQNCEHIMTRINALEDFAENYLGYHIEIQKKENGNQYQPDEILGFNIQHGL